MTTVPYCELRASLDHRESVKKALIWISFGPAVLLAAVALARLGLGWMSEFGAISLTLWVLGIVATGLGIGVGLPRLFDPLARHAAVRIIDGQRTRRDGPGVHQP